MAQRTGLAANILWLPSDPLRALALLGTVGPWAVDHPHGSPAPRGQTRLTPCIALAMPCPASHATSGAGSRIVGIAVLVLLLLLVLAGVAAIFSRRWRRRAPRSSA